MLFCTCSVSSFATSFSCFVLNLHMEERIVWAAVVALLSFSLYYILHSNSKLTEVAKEKSRYNLAVVILSARENVLQRQTIRETWLEHAKVLKNQVLVKFVVGQTGCDVHPDDRFDQFSCRELNISEELVSEEEKHALSYDAEEENYHLQSHKTEEFSFSVHVPVVLTKLGLLAEFLLHKEEHSSVAVSLLSAGTDEVIVNTTFDNFSDDVVDGYVYKTVDPFLLPKDYEGTIRLDHQENILNLSLTDRGKIIADNWAVDIRMLDLYGRSQTSLVSFGYRLHSSVAIKEHVSQIKDRQKFWQEHLLLVEAQLMKEAEQHQDLIFVNVLDTYRNLPNKLLSSFEWLTANIQFNFAMKTDDDCYIDIENVYKQITQGDMRGKDKVWWGNFREDWVVERTGKWAEPDYTASVYPSFACGSGSVLSADVVHWLSDNSGMLKAYQGEDVSMGIWLAALGVRYMEDKRWRCEKDCTYGMLSLPELNVLELRKLWKNRKECGDPCGCEG